MAPSKAPISAVAARKARQQAEAEVAAARSPASASRSSRRTSASRHQAPPENDDEAEVHVVLPLPTASQAVNLEADTRSSIAEPSSKRSRRVSHTAPALDSIATSRPRRRSSTSGARPSTVTFEPPSKSAEAGPSQTTPGRRSAKAAASSLSTSASSRKKRKSPRASNLGKEDSDFDRGLQDIIDELGLGESRPQDASEQETSEDERPPPKKRNRPAKSQSSNTRRKSATSDVEPPTKRKTSTPRRSSANKPPTKQTSDASTTTGTPKKGRTSRNKSALENSEDSASSKRQSWLLTPDDERRKAAMRYFASEEKAQKKKAKASTSLNSSSIPIEDQETGFLAFGDDDEESNQEGSVGSDAETSASEGDAGNSSGQDDDDEDAEDQVATHTEERRRSPQRGAKAKQTGKTNGRQGVNDASDDDEEGMVAMDERGSRVTEQAVWDAIPYSRFHCVLEGPAPNMIIKENKRKRAREALYFGLRCDQTLVFLGVGHIRVLRGCAQIGGAIVSASTIGLQSASIYAPVCNTLPVLKAVSAVQLPGHGDGSDSLSEIAEDEEPDAKQLLAQGFDTVVKVTPLSSPITALGQVCPIGGLATPFSIPLSLELRKVHQLSTIKVLLAPDLAELSNVAKNLASEGTWATAGLSATYIPHQWQKALHRISLSALSAAQHPQEESVVALIRGSRKVGKSTLSRMALERLLSLGRTIGGRVAYLELDLGQSDFGPPGMVALHIFGLEDTAPPSPRPGRDDEDEDAQLTDELSTDSQATVTCVKLGPGWCQPRVPARAHFIGDVSPRDDPESYVAAIHDLIEYFRSEVQPGQTDASTSGMEHRVPLVINTQGWIKGLGADLAARLEPLLRPTHIFDVIPRNASEPVPAPTRGMPWLDAEGAILAAGPEIIPLESVSQVEFVQGTFGQRDGRFIMANGSSTDVDDRNGPGDGGATPPRYVTDVGAKLAPAESRLLNVMSYLYAQRLSPAGVSGSTSTGGSWDFSEPLVHHRPLAIDVQRGLKAGIRVLALGSSVTDSLKLMALNSSIVAILVSDDDDQDDAGSELAASPWKLAFDRATQDAERGLSTRCIGLGIVRSIDVAAGQVHLLTPLDPAFIHEAFPNKAIGLVKGALDLPVWASLDFEAIKEARESRLDVPPASAESGAANDEASVPAQPLLAGMPRCKVPYLEWPHAAGSSIRPGKAKRGQVIGAANGPVQLGADKRRVRRNLMRKSQFA